MQDLGARIKELRKERKLTLAQLAGEKLTKGMLSLIENGKAQPSMDSLHYIASQLGIDVSELMQKNEGENYRTLLQEVEERLNHMDELFKQEKIDEQMQVIIDLIEPHVQQGKLKGATFEEARLFAIYLEMRFYLKIDQSPEPIYEAIKLYENVHAYSSVLKCFSLLCWSEFKKQKYERALDYLLEAETYIEKYGKLIDNLAKLDLYYNITVVYAALNDEQKSTYYTELALKIAKKDQILYRLNDFYRFLFFVNVFNDEAEKSLYYLRKLRAFGEILEDPIEDLTYVITELQYINMIEKDYKRTLSIVVEEEAYDPAVMQIAGIFLNGEYAYALWSLGRMNEAKEKLNNLYLPEQNKHPLDLVRIYRSFALRSLCYLHEGDLENAKRDILYASDGVKDFQDTNFKRFILEAYEQIMTHN